MRHAAFASLVVVSTCLLAGCAHEEPLPAPDVLPPEAQSMPESGRFVLTGIRQPIVALISQTGVQGPDVNLTVSADGAEGIVSRSPFNLNVTPGPDGMVVNGLIGGAPSTVTISKSRINGGFGRCGYDIHFQGQAYVGPRNCGGSIIQVGVTLPTILTTWSDAEVATVLSLLLSGR